MSEESNRMLRGGARAVTGVIIIAAAATSALVLGATELPVIERQPASITVNTEHQAARYFVCPGPYAELGADPTRPGTSIPTGITDLTVAGEPGSITGLQREEAVGSAPEVFRVQADELFAAAQTQLVVTDTLRGTTAAPCAEPVNEQWLVGGKTSLGASAAVALGNPTATPATVQLTVYDENGRVDSALTTGVLVPAGTERIVSLNGYAPGRESLAVRVESTGSVVSAALLTGEVSGLVPIGVDTMASQLGPENSVYFPGVANISDHQHGGPGDAGELDPFPVIVRAFAPGSESGSAAIRAVFPDGTSESIGELALSADAVNETPIEHWPEGAEGLVIDASVPIVAGVMGSADLPPMHDYAWFAPAPQLDAGVEVDVAAVVGSQLVLMNPGAGELNVTVTERAPVDVRASGADGDAGDSAADGVGAEPGGASSAPGSTTDTLAESEQVSERVITVPAGAAVAITTNGWVTLNGDAPFHASVRVAAGAEIAGYPVLPEPERVGTITVYPR